MSIEIVGPEIEAKLDWIALTEALEAVTRHTLGPLGFHRIEAITDPRNTRSRRLLEGCGYLLEGITRESYVWEGIRTDSAIYSRLAH